MLNKLLAEYRGFSPLTTKINTLSIIKDCINIESIGMFYRNYRLREGDLISITCTMSGYAPLVIGSPFKKRKAHLRFRKGLSGEELSDDSDSDSDDFSIDEEKSDNDNDNDNDNGDTEIDAKIRDKENEEKEREASIDCMLAFTAGQMVWRMADDLLLDWNFLGLYQSIVRNSIPLFVKKEYYKEVVDEMFIENHTSTVEATIVGRIITLPSDFTDLFKVNQDTKASALTGMRDVKPKICGKYPRPPFGIAVLGKDNGTSISYNGKSHYLDGDI